MKVKVLLLSFTMLLSMIGSGFMGSDVMETGEVSKKLGRGKQTTRHTELLYLGDDTFIFDSPNFFEKKLPGEHLVII